MEVFSYVFFIIILVRASWQQDWPPFPFHQHEEGCRQETDTTTPRCVSKVYCVDRIGNVVWNQNSFSHISSHCTNLFYWNGYLFGETIYTLKNFRDDVILYDTVESNFITTLDLSNNEYTDAPKITSITHLWMLNLSRNALTEAKLYNIYELENLSEIDLSYNTINTITVDHSQHVFTKLRKIDLSHNYLVSLEDGIFESFPELQELDLSFNFIDFLTKMTFEGIKNLLYLNLNHNRLSNLHSSLFRFGKLKTLEINNNKIQTLKYVDIEKLTNLNTLDLSYNLIMKVDDDVFKSIYSMQSLNLSNNLLENVGKEIFLNMSVLEELNLSNNRLKSLPKYLLKDKRVSKFCITKNKLEGSLVKGMFEGLKFVTDLDLSSQQLTSIDDYAFYGLEKLTFLTLNNNRLRTLSKKSFSTLQSLDTLDLSNNLLTNIDFEMNDLISLRSLILKKNQLIQVTHEYFNGLSSLQFLDLSSNNISQLETNSFHSLSYLINFQIANNPIRGALKGNTFDGLNSLPSLDFSGTFLTAIENGSLDGMNQLKELNASRCRISELQYNSFLHTGLIQTIDLSFNELRDFYVNTTELLSLNKLILNNNLLTAISPICFKGLPRLTSIILSHNQIKTIDDRGFQDQKDLRQLDLSYNPNLILNISQLAHTQNLDSLHLSGIRTNITFRSVKTTEFSRLEMSQSDISNVTFVGLEKLKSLEHLVLSHNNVTKVESTAFRGVINLRDLDLSFNKISFIQPGAFKENSLLIFLNISHNMLTAVGYGIFRGLIYLNTIDISYNEISDLNSERFYEVESLNVLIADHNKISNVNSNDFYGTHLLKLSIGDNPIPCHVLVNLKKADINFAITAIKLDENSDDENVDGVTCNKDIRIVPNKPENKDLTNERILIDIKNILLNMSYVKTIEKAVTPASINDSQYLTNISDQIVKMDSNINTTLVQGNYNMSVILDKLSSTIAQGNTITNTLLEKMIKLIAKTQKTDQTTIPPLSKENMTAADLIPYINKIKQDLENAMSDEKQNIYDEIDKRISSKLFVSNPAATTPKVTAMPTQEAYSGKNGSYVDSNSLIFIEVCVGLMLVLMIAFIMHKFYNSGMFVPSRYSSSTRHLPGSMENSAL